MQKLKGPPLDNRDGSHRKRKRSRARDSTSVSPSRGTEARQGSIADLLRSQKAHRRGYTPNKRLKDTSHESSSSPPQHNSTEYSFFNMSESALTSSKRPVDRGGVPQVHSFQPHAGAKRMVVRTLGAECALGLDDYLEQTWARTDATLAALCTEESIPYSVEDIYRGIESICKQNAAAKMFRKLEARCHRHVKATLRDPLMANAASGLSDLDIVFAVRAAWLQWSEQTMVLRSIFFFMDKFLLLTQTELPPVSEMALAQFRMHVLLDTPLKDRAIQGVCDLIDLDRKGSAQSIDLEAFGDFIEMLHSLSLYQPDFEAAFLGHSQSYFDNWTTEMARSAKLPSYAASCELLLNQEVERCERYHLSSTTRDNLIGIVEDFAITRKLDIFENEDAIATLLDRHDKECLSRTFSLLNRVGMAHRLKKPWKAYIQAKGVAIVGDDHRESEMIVRLIGLKIRMEIICSVCFNKDEALVSGLRESFEHIMNEKSKSSSRTRSRVGELIAKYIDSLLRGGSQTIPLKFGNTESYRNIDDNELMTGRSMEDSPIKNSLTLALDIFRSFQGKDFFESFYRNDLARRLLLQRSTSEEGEIFMVTKLKADCGEAFTTEIEKMYEDIAKAKEEMSNYKAARLEHGKKDALDLNVYVLSSSAWPSYPDISVKLPPEVEDPIKHYDTYYKSKRAGRMLSWKHSLAQCVLKANLAKGEKEITLSAFQAIVLLLFNDVPAAHGLSFTQIQTATELPSEELIRTLQSLACAKYRILSKTPRGRDINNKDVFMINEDFNEPKYRIRINQIQLKETNQEKETIHERVEENRNAEIQSAIMRIMKRQKTIVHNDLVSEVFTELEKRSSLDAKEVKHNIEKLVEKDYLERDGDSYVYVK
ncbi:MAG: hypothetical protein M1829_002953 [Trizodia sp. TS-e1964]|nr:MAG: hypothetical protein M1829_002953 [Trizodia sp. TS-e1964]